MYFYARLTMLPKLSLNVSTMQVEPRKTVSVPIRLDYNASVPAPVMQ